MDILEKLYRKAAKEKARFMIRFDPTEPNDAQWSIKYYPDPDDNANFWAESDTMSGMIRQLLDEVEGFK